MGSNTKEWLNEAKESKTADNHFFAQDAPLSRRLHTAAAGFAPEHLIEKKCAASTVVR